MNRKVKMTETRMAEFKKRREAAHLNMLARLEAKAKAEGEDSIWAEMLREHKGA